MRNGVESLPIVKKYCTYLGVEVEGSDKVGLLALVRAALTAVSSAAGCAVVKGWL